MTSPSRPRKGLDRIARVGALLLYAIAILLTIGLTR